MDDGESRIVNGSGRRNRLRIAIDRQ